MDYDERRDVAKRIEGVFRSTPLTDEEIRGGSFSELLRRVLMLWVEAGNGILWDRGRLDDVRRYVARYEGEMRGRGIRGHFTCSEHEDGYLSVTYEDTMHYRDCVRGMDGCLELSVGERLTSQMLDDLVAKASERADIAHDNYIALMDALSYGRIDFVGLFRRLDAYGNTPEESRQAEEGARDD